MRQLRSRMVYTITKRIDCRAMIQEVQNSSSMEPSVSSSPSLSGLQGIRMGIAAPLISPEEMQRRVFMAVEEEAVVDTIFLVSVIVEYMRSAAREHVRVPPGLQAFVVKLLARDERFNELHQFIAGKLVEPSRAVALQLVEVGTHHTPTRKLGMEMLRLLHAHSDYVKLLLQDGRMLEGLRYIRRNKVVLSVSSSLVLLVTGLAHSNIISVQSHGVIPS
jgi:hypothetical protein